MLCLLKSFFYEWLSCAIMSYLGCYSSELRMNFDFHHIKIIKLSQDIIHMLHRGILMKTELICHAEYDINDSERQRTAYKLTLT